MGRFNYIGCFWHTLASRQSASANIFRLKLMNQIKSANTECIRNLKEIEGFFSKIICISIYTTAQIHSISFPVHFVKGWFIEKSMDPDFINDKTSI